MWVKMAENQKSDEEAVKRIAKALERIADVLESQKQVTEEGARSDLVVVQASEKKLSNGFFEIKSATPEELAYQIILFSKKEFPDEHDSMSLIKNTSRIFWDSKGVDKDTAPVEIQAKIDKAEKIAEQKMGIEREDRHGTEMGKDRQELPSLIYSCVDWAKDKGLKTLLQTDVDKFLKEKSIAIQDETKMVLWTKARAELKSKIR